MVEEPSSSDWLLYAIRTTSSPIVSLNFFSSNRTSSIVLPFRFDIVFFHSDHLSFKKISKSFRIKWIFIQYGSLSEQRYYREKMCDRASQNEYMPDSMMITEASPHIKDCTDRIKYAANNQKSQSFSGHRS